MTVVGGLWMVCGCIGLGVVMASGLVVWNILGDASETRQLWEREVLPRWEEAGRQVRDDDMRLRGWSDIQPDGTWRRSVRRQ